jgi:hypothetical protein
MACHETHIFDICVLLNRICTRATSSLTGTMITATGWSGRSPVSHGASLLPLPLAPWLLPGCLLPPAAGCLLPAAPLRCAVGCTCDADCAFCGFCLLYGRPAVCSRFANSCRNRAQCLPGSRNQATSDCMM